MTAQELVELEYVGFSLGSEDGWTPSGNSHHSDPHMIAMHAYLLQHRSISTCASIVTDFPLSMPDYKSRLDEV